MSRTGLVFHEHYLAHDPGPAVLGLSSTFYPYADPEPHVEHPLRVARVKELIDQSGLIERLEPVAPWPAEAEDIGLFHTREYIRRVLQVSATTRESADVGQGARITRGSYEVALLAAGGAIAAVDAVLDGQVGSCYALVRPPGHHAVADRGMGFCVFNNVAFAAWGPRAHDWVTEPGEFRILIGASVEDVHGEATVRLAGAALPSVAPADAPAILA
jgi:acetoin utilization deacetylase AcuC-like enzyme